MATEVTIRPFSERDAAQVRDLFITVNRLGERNSAEIARVMASYFHARDEFEPVSRQELLDRLRCGSAAVLDARAGGRIQHRSPAERVEHPLGAARTAARRVARQSRDCRLLPRPVLSFEAVALLRSRGYQVRRLENGFPEWKMAGLPINQL